MKLNFKMIAVAAAMAAAGSAHAELVGANVAGGPGSTGSSLALVAFNSVTNSYYVRDLGLTLNSFLPSSVTTLVGDGGVTGTRTSEAGSSFSSSDAAFGTWLAGQTASDVRWTLTAGDSLSTGANGVGRLLLAINGTATLISNSAVRTAATVVTGLLGQNPGMGLSATGATVLPALLQNTILQAATLSLLDAASSLFYFAATTQTGSTATAATATQFGNSGGFASVNLASNGDFTSSLAAAGEPPAAVPVPAAAWLLGSGLLGIAGMVRRRKAAAQA